MLLYILSFRNHSTQTAMSLRGQHCGELHRPQRGKSKRLSDCCLPGVFFPPLSLEFCLPFSSFSAKIFLPPPGRICNCCIASAKGKLSLETLLKSSPGLGVSGNSHKSWIWVAFQPLHCAHQTLRLSFHSFCSVLSPCVPILLYRDECEQCHRQCYVSAWCISLVTVSASRQ